MMPLQVTATLHGEIALPNGPLALDALIGWAIVMRDALPVATIAEECVPLSIPIEKEPAGRFYMASFSCGTVEARTNRYVNRRFPIPEAQMLAAPKFKTIKISAGATKSYRLPLEMVHYDGDSLTWWCIGEPVEIRELLALVGYLGKRRAVGYGRVEQWSVEPCATWRGFPVVRDGQPLRSLPPDWPGLSNDVERAFRVLEPPYWRRSAEELCVVPRWA